MATIELRDVFKKFYGDLSFADSAKALVQPLAPAPAGENPKPVFAFKNLNLSLPNGKVTVILGPSGCGKSTLLRLIAGFIHPDSGQVLFDGKDTRRLSIGERKIGMVFQNYALYPQYTAKANILSYFLFKKRTPELDREAEERYRRTSELMGVNIEYLLDRKPAHLSGGERQRVAIARCITRDPKLFLLDEPFANIDEQLRQSYRVQLKRLLREFSVTTVYVTHNQQEALGLADRIAVMNTGTIEQVDHPRVIYHQPASLFVADFLGFDPDATAISRLDGALVLPELAGFTVGVRPEDVDIGGEPATFGVTGRVAELHPLPLRKLTRLTIDVAGHTVETLRPAEETFEVGQTARLHLQKIHLFDKKSGLRVRTEFSQTAAEQPHNAS
ncbi:MAG: ABC transporter ATP-binding protein [Chloroflexi bacterium]|nr:MAG: ABC transporter ATP-binding protein [Chloroflexota bacterium]